MEDKTPKSQASESKAKEKPRYRRSLRRLLGGIFGLASVFIFINREKIAKDVYGILSGHAHDRMLDPKINVNNVVIKSLYVPTQYSVDRTLLDKWWQLNKDQHGFEDLSGIIQVLRRKGTATRSNLRGISSNDSLFTRLRAAGVLRPIPPSDPLDALAQSVDVTVEFRLNSNTRKGEGYEVDNECRLLSADSSKSSDKESSGIRLLLNGDSDPGVDPSLGPKRILLTNKRHEHIGVFDSESIIAQQQSREVDMLKRAVQGGIGSNERIVLQCEFVDGANRLWLVQKPQPHGLQVDRS